MLVLGDRETPLLSAEPTARQFVRDLEGLGHHRRLVIWCDQEAALESLVGEVAGMGGDAVTISGHSAVGYSQGQNGFIEHALDALYNRCGEGRSCTL